jgi:hypothetical protein
MENQELTIDQAVELMEGKQPEPVEETPTEKPEPEQKPEEVVEEAEETTETPVEEKPEEESPAPIDYNLKVKFKANGQEVEKSIQDLINDAQLASNYNQKMQEIATQRKAFEAALQQPQQPQQPQDNTAKFVQLHKEVSERAMKNLGVTNPQDFYPDPIAFPEHYAAYQDALVEIKLEKANAQHSQETQLKEYSAQEERYNSFFEEQQRTDKDYSKVTAHVFDSFWQLPQKGDEGKAQFQQLYPIMLKINERLALLNNPDPRVKVAPFTAAEVNAITAFYADAKKDYYAKQTKETVKAAVPKSVPIKPTVKVESTGDNTPALAKKIDLKKVREMDLDEVAKML